MKMRRIAMPPFMSIWVHTYMICNFSCLFCIFFYDFRIREKKGKLRWFFFEIILFILFLPCGRAEIYGHEYAWLANETKNPVCRVDDSVTICCFENFMQTFSKLKGDFIWIWGLCKIQFFGLKENCLIVYLVLIEFAKQNNLQLVV